MKRLKLTCQLLVVLCTIGASLIVWTNSGTVNQVEPPGLVPSAFNSQAAAGFEQLVSDSGSLKPFSLEPLYANSLVLDAESTNFFSSIWVALKKRKCRLSAAEQAALTRLLFLLASIIQLPFRVPYRFVTSMWYFIPIVCFLYLMLRSDSTIQSLYLVTIAWRAREKLSTSKFMPHEVLNHCSKLFLMWLGCLLAVHSGWTNLSPLADWRLFVAATLSSTRTDGPGGSGLFALKCCVLVIVNENYHIVAAIQSQCCQIWLLHGAVVLCYHLNMLWLNICNMWSQREDDENAASNAPGRCYKGPVVNGKGRQSAPPPKPEDVKPALRKDLDRVKAKLKAQNLIIAQGRTPQAKIKATHTKAGHKKLAVKDSSKYIKTNIKAPREQSAEQSAASRI